jgi:hypothetical protein
MLFPRRRVFKENIWAGAENVFDRVALRVDKEGRDISKAGIIRPCAKGEFFPLKKSLQYAIEMIE